MAATVTGEETVRAAVLFEESVTAVPPVGAAREMVTVQVLVALEATVAGVHDMAVTVMAAGAVIVREAVAELLPRVAVTTAI